MTNMNSTTNSTPSGALGAPQLPTPSTRGRQADVLGGTFCTDWEFTTFHTISAPAN